MASALGVLYLLAVMDGLIAGYRDSLGRNPLHMKGKYFAWACLRGVFLVHVVLLIAACGGFICYKISGVYGINESDLSLSAAAYARRMAWIYGGYAGAIAAGLLVYVGPMFEVRSYITIGIFGVLTMLRPYVIALGVVLAAMHVHGAPGWWLVTCVAGCTGAMMIGLDRLHQMIGWNAFDWDELMGDEVKQG
jgi:hypothetical protein